MNAYKFVTLIVVSVIVAILLASALNNFTHVADSALAEIAPTATPRTNAPLSITPAKRNYLPIVLLNPTISTSWLLSGNSSTNPATDFLGTTDKVTLTLRVSNTIAYRIVPAVNPSNGFAPNIIGGANTNSVGSSAYGATIAGGTSSTANGIYPTIGGGIANVIPITGTYATIGGGILNTASNIYATIGGGNTNTASGNDATIGGGSYNTVSGTDATVGGGDSNYASGSQATIGGGFGNIATNAYATVGGGQQNFAIDQFTTVGGGHLNTASNFYATVGGGEFNAATGSDATVPGGYLNSATAGYSFAAGDNAHANHSGAFVWADSTGASFASTAINQFLIRASGGVGIGTNSPSAQLTVSGAGAYNASGAARFDLYNSTAGDGFLQHVSNTGKWQIATINSASTRMVIDTNGNIGIGTDTPTKTLEVNGQIRVTNLSTGGPGTFSLCYTSAGDILGCSSSLRYKNNIADLTLGLDAIAKLRPVTFNWKDSGQADLGFVAEEVNQVTPLLTTLNKDGQIEGVKYDRVTAVLVKGMQEQQAQLQAKDAQISSLQSQVANLQSQIDAQQKVNASLDARLTALEQVPHSSTIDAGQANGIQSPDPLQGKGASAFTLNNLPVWGIVALLALWLVKRRK